VSSGNRATGRTVRVPPESHGVSASRRSTSVFLRDLYPVQDGRRRIAGGGAGPYEVAKRACYARREALRPARSTGCGGRRRERRGNPDSDPEFLPRPSPFGRGAPASTTPIHSCAPDATRPSDACRAEGRTDCRVLAHLVGRSETLRVGCDGFTPAPRVLTGCPVIDPVARMQRGRSVPLGGRGLARPRAAPPSAR